MAITLALKEDLIVTIIIWNILLSAGKLCDITGTHGCFANQARAFLVTRQK